MKKQFMTFVLGCFSIAVSAIDLPKGFQLIPQPQQVEVKSLAGLNHQQLTYILCKDNATFPPMGSLVEALPRSKRPGKGITLQLVEQPIAAKNSTEAYLLEVNKDGVLISANTQEGLFYGLQTLEQLMEDSRDFQLTIPSMKITDYPAIAYRAVHFDTKHHLSRAEYYYRVIDKLARYKVNAVIWEVEDKLRYTRRPEIGAGNALSKQEMNAIARYAQERNINISPLVQGLGHASFILKHHWELSESPTSDWEFCPSDPRTYEVQFDLYRDALEAFPTAKYLHVGGDEITAIGIDDRCKATGKSALQLQMEWLKKVCDFATANGKTPIFWDDMPLKEAKLWGLLDTDLQGEELEKKWNSDALDKAINLFPKECVYMRWNYGNPTKPAHMKLLEWYASKGLKVMAATAASAGDSPYMPRNKSRVPNVKAFNELTAKNGLEGILATAWDDGSAHWETIMRGVIAQGEYGWNPIGRDVDAYLAAHAQREFGFKSTAGLTDFINQMEQLFFFFDGALVQSGRRNPAWGTTAFTLISLPDKDKPKEWSTKYAEKLSKAKEAKQQYEVISKAIAEAESQALRNRYTLDVYQQTAELGNYPTRLLLALETYDNAADDNARSKARTELLNVCNDLQTLRSQLEYTYGSVRFMQNPEGYIADHNHHNHLSAKSNDASWIFYYEIPMVKSIKRWLGEK